MDNKNKQLVINLFYTVSFWCLQAIWVVLTALALYMIPIMLLINQSPITPTIVVATVFAIVVPIVTAIVGVILMVRRKFKQLWLVFLAVSTPLFLLTLFVIFVVPQVGIELFIGLTMCLIGATTLLLDTTTSKPDNESSQPWKALGYGIGAVATAYIFIVWIWFVPDVVFTSIAAPLNSLAIPTDPSQFISAILGLLMLTGLFGLLSLFFFSPAYCLFLYCRAWWRNVRSGMQSQQKGTIVGLGVTAAIVFGIFGLMLVNYTTRPEYQAIRINEQVASIDSDNAKQTYLQLLDAGDSNREALLLQYLADRSYPFDYTDNFFAGRYCNNNDSDTGVCKMAFDFIKTIAFPVFYPGDYKLDASNSIDSYSQIFDVTIQEAHGEEIASAAAPGSLGMRAFRPSDGAVGIIDTNDQQVLVSNVDIEAEVFTTTNLYRTTYTLTLRNRNVFDQEAFIEFEVPEYSVVNNLSLGPNLEHPGQFAPVGAATEVYEGSITRNVDPALMTQVGPRLYRLRVYPVPSNSNNAGGTLEYYGSTNAEVITKLPRYTKVQFTVSGRTGSKLEIIPFAYQRNLVVSDFTLINADLDIIGAGESSIQGLTDPDEWEVSSSDLFGTEPLLVMDNFNIDNSACSAINTDLNISPKQVSGIENVKLLVDISASNLNHRTGTETKAEWQQVVDYLTATVSPDASYDIYAYNYQLDEVASDAQTSEIDAKLQELELWGYTDSDVLASQLQGNAHDLIVVISDSSQFEYYEDKNPSIDYLQVGSPVMLFEIGPTFSPQKQFTTASVYLSGGSSHLSNELEDPVDYSCGIPAMEPSSAEVDIIRSLDGYLSGSVLADNADDFTQLLATISERTAATEFVNPFVAEIAIVTDQQQQQLDELSEEDDAYDAKFENGEFGLPMSMDSNINMGAIVLVLLVVVAVTLSHQQQKRVEG